MPRCVCLRARCAKCARIAYAVVGQVGNIDHSNIKLGKAGRKRHLGIRPTVRGSAMSPRDHPHGGGEGRQPIGKPGPRSPWGKPTLGKKTRNNKRTDQFIVRRRTKKRPLVERDVEIRSVRCRDHSKKGRSFSPSC